MRTVQEVANQTLSSVPGFISTIGQSYHFLDGMGCRHVYWSSWEEHRPILAIVRKRSLVSHVPYVPSRYSHDFPLYLFYSPQPSVQIYLGYGHCTPIVVSPISALVGAPMVLFVIDAKKEK